MCPFRSHSSGMNAGGLSSALTNQNKATKQMTSMKFPAQLRCIRIRGILTAYSGQLEIGMVGLESSLIGTR